MAPLGGKELVERLTYIGKKLEFLFEPKDVLLYILAKVGDCLHMVDESHFPMLQATMISMVKSLGKLGWLRHTYRDVRIVLTYCLSEILRIFSLEAPYNDDTLGAILQLLVDSFESLKNIRSSHFSRRLSILEAFAKTRMKNILLDLELDELIYEIFHHFIASARKEYANNVISTIRDIMKVLIYLGHSYLCY